MILNRQPKPLACRLLGHRQHAQQLMHQHQVHLDAKQRAWTLKLRNRYASFLDEFAHYMKDNMKFLLLSVGLQ